jgi:hypothetical protein
MSENLTKRPSNRGLSFVHSSRNAIRYSSVAVHPHRRSRAEAFEGRTDVDIAPLVQKIGATSIAEVEKMIGELQAAKDFLESEGERVQREAEQYTTLTQMASASVKIISDTVAGWREAGHPLRDHSSSSQFDLTLSPAEDNSTSAGVPDQHQPATDPSPDPREAIP